MKTYTLNKTATQEINFKHVATEISILKQALNKLMEENVYLKNKVVEILKNEFDKKMLNTLEDFQNNFIKEDDLIALLRYELAQTDILLLQNAITDRKHLQELLVRLQLLHKTIHIVEEQFFKLKADFNNWSF